MDKYILNRKISLKSIKLNHNKIRLIRMVRAKRIL